MINLAKEFAKGKELISIIRLGPVGMATAEERSKDRYRRIGVSAAASATAKGVSLLTTFITVPLTLNYLGVERYGLWVAMSSTIAMLAFADLGIGNGLINAVAEANGKDDKELARRYVSSAFFVLLGIALVLSIGFAMVLPRISWEWLLNLSDPGAIAEAGPAIAIFLACFVVNVPLGMIQRIQMGYQESFLNSMWQALGNVLGLGGVLLVISLKGGLPWIVFSMTGTPILSTVANGVVLLAGRRRWLLPRLHCVSGFAVRRILQLGFLFFALQIAVAMAYQSDNVIISHFLGASYVPQYAIPMKLFMLFPLVSGFILTPLWPAYGEAVVRHDVEWIRKTFARSVKWALAINTPAAVLLVVFFPVISKAWIGADLRTPFVVLVGMGLWTILNGLSAPIAMLLNGTNTIRLQVRWALVMAGSNILLSIFLVQRIGIAGPIYGTVITWTLFNLVPYMIQIPRMFAAWASTGQQLRPRNTL